MVMGGFFVVMYFLDQYGVMGCLFFYFYYGIFYQLFKDMVKFFYSYIVFIVMVIQS